MARDKSNEAAAMAATPRFIKLGDDWGSYREGKVLLADADLLSRLDKDGILYATATDRERQIAGFADQLEA